MIVRDLIEILKPTIINEGDNLDTVISGPACCDLLSIAMGNLPEKCAWVTVMSNINSIAVASLTDAACIVLSYGTASTPEFEEKARETGTTVFGTKLATFDAALLIQKALEASND